jgi:hypothetical protein
MLLMIDKSGLTDLQVFGYGRNTNRMVVAAVLRDQALTNSCRA